MQGYNRKFLYNFKESAVKSHCNSYVAGFVNLLLLSRAIPSPRSRPPCYASLHAFHICIPFITFFMHSRMHSRMHSMLNGYRIRKFATGAQWQCTAQVILYARSCISYTMHKLKISVMHCNSRIMLCHGKSEAECSASTFVDRPYHD